MTFALKLFNTQTEKLEAFTPDPTRAVTIYVCGVTPYDTTHMGHAATYVTYDVLMRYLEYAGFSVRYVQNVTDIDDDILRKAGAVGDDWRALGNRWTAHLIEDLLALNVRPPEEYARATETIPEIIASVQALLDHGVAYVSAGNVYFSVEKNPDFGQLSHIPEDERLAIANERGNHPDDPHKQNPLDFVLWQAAATGEPHWDSPWGPGRPGWHIECSSMIHKWLGPQIDIHGGGSDLIFPHHECEIAQSECAGNPRPFVRLWLHTAMVGYQGEKMSKSLGNLVMARDVLKQYSANALRVYISDHRYRQPWAFEWNELPAAAALAGRLEHAAQFVAPHHGAPFNSTEAERSFMAALNADLGTPQALRTLDSFAAQLIAQAEFYNVRDAQQKLIEMAAVLGLALTGDGPEMRVRAGWSRQLTRFQA